MKKRTKRRAQKHSFMRSFRHSSRHSFRQRSKTVLRRHAVSISIVLITLVACVALVLFAWNANTQAAKEISTRNDQLNAKIAEAKAAREARLAAEAEKARLAAAEATKEQVLTQSAESIDPKTCNNATSHIDPSRIDVLVNKKHCLQPLTFVPALVSTRGARLTPEAAEAFNRLVTASLADGMSLGVTSSYRSYQDQVATYNRWVSISGREEADTYSARPGYSEHQTGLTLDVSAPGCNLDCFGGTKEYEWMQAHAANYGFIQRYYKGEESVTGYKAEEWHYRYVGITVAKDMQNRGIKTLEEYWGLPGGDY